MSRIAHDGLMVAPTQSARGSFVFAEVVPAGSCWLPLPGRASRWWYEVHAVHGDDDRTTFAYIERGSGGAFTLARCIRRATDAVQHFAEGYDDV